MSTDHHGLGRTQCQQPAPSGSGPDGSHRIVERKVEVPTPREFSPPHAGFRGRVRQPGAYLPIALATGGQRLWLWRGSNPRPAHYECAALPSELHSVTSSVRSWLWRRPDSNRRLRGYEPRGLTELPYSAFSRCGFQLRISAMAPKLVDRTGIEPVPPSCQNGALPTAPTAHGHPQTCLAPHTPCLTPDVGPLTAASREAGSDAMLGWCSPRRREDTCLWADSNRRPPR